MTTEQGFPQYWVKERVDRAKNTLFLGVPLTELTHDELLAAAVEAIEGMARQKKLHDQHTSFLKTLSEIHKRHK